MKTVYVSRDNLETASIICRKTDDFIEKTDEEVKMIIKDVKQRGEVAVLEYTYKFDQVKLDELKVTEEEFDYAFSHVEKEFQNIIQDAYKNIMEFHEKQMEKTWMDFSIKGKILGQMVTPIERVGIYVPGGTAAYPSTVLMNSIPAKIAGVSSIAMVTPPMKDGTVNPYILVAAKIAGVDEIYKIGGAQAIAALAYGTENIKKVHKIVGPGNHYVAMAKKSVYGLVDIDMIAGPSEICVVADEGANPRFIAADLLSQAEHDELASSILITTSESLAQKVQIELKEQIQSLDRKNIALKSIENFGMIFIVDNMETGLELANDIAPEHLELMMEFPLNWLPYVKNAGAIFMGAYSPEPLGDYFAGPNHTLPTNGTAKFSSPLGVEDFIKKSSIIYYDESTLYEIKDSIIKFAEKEGLSAHANSIKVRF